MEENSFTHKWIPRVDQQEKNLFVEEYYSSTDTQIKMNDEEQTEIGYINYSVQEQLKPLYGYSSRTFDDIAIGNRIVTGTFKVPIKNTQDQTQLEEIKSQSVNTNTDNEDYNEKQNKLQQAVEWISNKTNNNIFGKFGNSDDEFNYSKKLEALGILYETINPPAVSIAKQIKKFQEQNNLDVTGILTEPTKKAIDFALNLSSLNTIELLVGTKIYTGPSELCDIITTLNEKQTAYMLDVLDNWKHIMLPDSIEGFIKPWQGGNNNGFTNYFRINK